MFAVFAATIAAFILQPFPNSINVLLAITFCVGADLTKIGAILADSFGNATVWLVFIAFLISKGFVKTRLGNRIAYILIKMFGSSSLKLAYVLAGTDLIIAPATPSVTARAGGIIFPITKSLCEAMDSTAGPTARRLGSFLMLSAIFVNAITASMFMTAMVSNPLIAELAKKVLGIEMTWAMWFYAAVVPGIISLLVIPYYLYKAYPPELKELTGAKEHAVRELEKMGPMTTSEKMMLGVFITIIVLWATSSFTKLDATFIGFFGVAVMLVADIINWNDVLEEKGAWDTFIWLGGMIGLAGFLAKTGFIKWFAASVGTSIAGVDWTLALVALLLIYTYSHYGFASLSAHVTALYAAFAAVAVSAGAPAYLSALTLGFASNLCSTLTQYGSAPAPIFFGAGYVDQMTWWKHGFVVCTINLFIWVVFGGMWWKVIGLW
jgi:DASS family divalent anion:Na+ symporter